MGRVIAGALRFSGAPREALRLLQAQAVSMERMCGDQARALGTIVSWAKGTAPYFASTLPSLEQIEQDPVAALGATPVLTKSLMRTEGVRLLANRKRAGVRRNTSGGSTGEPAVFYQDAAYRRWNRAGKLLFDHWTGVSAGHRKAVLWAVPSELADPKPWRRRLRERLWNRYTLNAYRMSDGNLRAYLDRLEADPPDQLQVYAESGFELGRFALAEGRRINGITAVLSSAGTLYSDMRETMEEAFGAPVFNRYGSREVGDIACECSMHRGLHVNPVTHYVEVLRDDDAPAASGELGRVVVTSLTNFTQPLIRYEIGDMARWSEEECPCGSKWPLLAEVSGRVTDQLKAVDGTLVYGGALRQFLYEMPYVQKYQWVQYRLEQITLRIVVDANAPPSELDWQRDVHWLEQEVQEVLGDRIRLHVEIVDEIPPSPSGKHLYVRSEVE